MDDRNGDRNHKCLSENIYQRGVRVFVDPVKKKRCLCIERSVSLSVPFSKTSNRLYLNYISRKIFVFKESFQLSIACFFGPSLWFSLNNFILSPFTE